MPRECVEEVLRKIGFLLNSFPYASLTLPFAQWDRYLSSMTFTCLTMTATIHAESPSGKIHNSNCQPGSTKQEAVVTVFESNCHGLLLL